MRLWIELFESDIYLVSKGYGGRGGLISSEAAVWHCLRYRELCILRAVIWLSIQASSFLFPFFMKHFRTQAGNICLCSISRQLRMNRLLLSITTEVPRRRASGSIFSRR